MQLHQLKPKTKNKSRKRIGRGGKRGTTSGRGTKGQKSRTGHKIRPALREFLKKIPKRRGIKNVVVSRRPQTIDIKLLDKHFESGEKVTPQLLFEKGLIKKVKGQSLSVKLLGEGDVAKKLLVENCQISGSAKEKIEKAGGSVSQAVDSRQ